MLCLTVEQRTEVFTGLFTMILFLEFIVYNKIHIHMHIAYYREGDSKSVN